ncbi:MAG TPA: autorepressor SdpR family transcription factor [Gemmatimonadaceae bacterium]|nr:autorepressor SdpR family transcription factor [Gemmatimonadaceae bacterium]
MHTLRAVNTAFKALADPTRREILQLLRNGPRSSGDIAAHFASSWPTISRHLGVLREAELILAERNGQQIVYELNTTVLEDVVEHLLGWMKPAGPPKPANHPGGKHAIRHA